MSMDGSRVHFLKSSRLKSCQAGIPSVVIAVAEVASRLGVSQRTACING